MIPTCALWHYCPPRLCLDGGASLLKGCRFDARLRSISINTLRRIAVAMTNPFGDDETDYELDYDLRRLWREAQETLARMPDEVDEDGRAAPRRRPKPGLKKQPSLVWRTTDHLPSAKSPPAPPPPPAKSPPAPPPPTVGTPTTTHRL